MGRGLFWASGILFLLMIEKERICKKLQSSISALRLCDLLLDTAFFQKENGRGEDIWIDHMPQKGNDGGSPVS